MIGQGSIGRRHSAILAELGHRAVGYDPERGGDTLAGVEVADGFEEALDGADAVVIASPSSEHAAQARRAIEQGIPTLVEKPLAADAARAAELERLAHDRGVLLAVGMNLRHHPAVLALRGLLAEGALGRVLRAAAWCGSWLPGWRPGTDYRTAYSASRELGGGVLLDVAVHELDYLLWLLGPATEVTAIARHVSYLEFDAEDVGLIALTLRGGAVVQLAVDYFDRSYHRGCRIVGERATAHWSWEAERLRLLGPEASIDDAVSSDVAPTYRRQMERFLAAVGGASDSVAAARDARHVLAVIDAARASACHGRRVAIPPPISLRPATASDSDRLLRWRNDPETRLWSRSQAEVATAEHQQWLARTLDDPAIALWIAETDGGPVGQVRATPEAPDAAEIHVSVAPEARGRGLGAEVITEAAARALADTTVRRLIAHVKEDNHASLRAFARAGFEQCGRDDAGLLRLERSACR